MLGHDSGTHTHTHMDRVNSICLLPFHGRGIKKCLNHDRAFFLTATVTMTLGLKFPIANLFKIMLH